MFKILTLNQISLQGLQQFPKEKYQISNESADPDAILVRSADLHHYAVPASLKAIARAGAGVNNIPIAQLTEKGIPVFNTPGANANAVKELVVAGMLMASRNIYPSWRYVQTLNGDDQQMDKAVEANKKQFVGFELTAKTLGVIGLGAIGVKVANAAIALGMNVIGYDPAITVQHAWELSALVKKAHSVEEILPQADFVSVHIPFMPATQDFFNAKRLQQMKNGAVLLNFSRAGIVNEEALFQALKDKKLRAYVCDFPNQRLLAHPQVIALPHLGASTLEAEENCAVMAVQQLREFLELGNIRNAVNYPEVVMPLSQGHRIGIANANVPNMVGQISTILAQANLNIMDLLNKSQGDVAYTLIDVNDEIPAAALQQIQQITGILSVRVIR
jgi:D-3-phosphoglycerate dehydrogenase